MICREKVEGEHKIIPRRLLYRTGEEMDLLNMLSAKKFADWINKARKGDKMTYYRGFLFAPNMQKYSPTQDLRRVNNMRKYCGALMIYGLFWLLLIPIKLYIAYVILVWIYQIFLGII